MIVGCTDCALLCVVVIFNRRSANVLAVLARVASRVLDRTGFYYSGKPPVVKKRATQLNRTSTLRYRLSVFCSASFKTLFNFGT